MFAVGAVALVDCFGGGVPLYGAVCILDGGCTAEPDDAASDSSLQFPDVTASEPDADDSSDGADASDEPSDDAVAADAPDAD